MSDRDEETAQKIILIAKGGISLAGIDERILIPNIAAALREARAEGLEEAMDILIVSEVDVLTHNQVVARARQLREGS